MPHCIICVLLSFQELEGILEEDPQNDEIDAVYIPPPVDILTDEEDLNDDLTMEEQSVLEIAGTFEIHTHSHLMTEKAQ